MPIVCLQIASFPAIKNTIYDFRSTFYLALKGKKCIGLENKSHRVMKCRIPNAPTTNQSLTFTFHTTKEYYVKPQLMQVCEIFREANNNAACSFLNAKNLI